jgi:Rrf2 family nitric oxide-sensitive transcriptional repressor
VRGRRGGIELARPPAQINLGAVVRDVEDDLALVPCFDPADASCPIQGSCRLQGVLGEALRAFFAVLDRYTLADLMRDREGALSSLLGMEAAPLLPLEQIRRQSG